MTHAPAGPPTHWVLHAWTNCFRLCSSARSSFSTFSLRRTSMRCWRSAPPQSRSAVGGKRERVAVGRPPGVTGFAGAVGDHARLRPSHANFQQPFWSRDGQSIAVSAKIDEPALSHLRDAGGRLRSALDPPARRPRQRPSRLVAQRTLERVHVRHEGQLVLAGISSCLRHVAVGMPYPPGAYHLLSVYPAPALLPLAGVRGGAESPAAPPQS
jgi:hypothetical protein